MLVQYILMNQAASNTEKKTGRSPSPVSQLLKGDLNNSSNWKKQKFKEQLTAVKLKTLMVSNALKKSTSQARYLMDSSPKKHNPLRIEQAKHEGRDPHWDEESPFFKKLEVSFKDIPKQLLQTEEPLKLKNSSNLSRQRVYNIPYFIQQQEQKYAIEMLKSNPEEKDLIAIPKPYSDSISTNSSTDRNNGPRLDDFSIGSSLGAGKFGQVYVARHRKTGFICALKQISIKALDEILMTQLIRQIKIQMFLNHPNIVKLYTFFKDNESESIYLVLQLCVSGQLYGLLRKRQDMPEDLGKFIIRQICQGLDCIHQNKIIHRDVKPENILYQNGMMKICDFGWSVNTHLMRETFCGTPLYVSPELLRKKFYDNKVDTWSLGVLSYEVLIGKVPFEIYTETDCIKIVTNEVSFPKHPEISPIAKDFIQQCLHKNPEKRPTSSQLLEHPFLNNVELINFPQIF